MSIITTEERNYLLSEMRKTLDKYDHCYETFALEKIIDTWAENKADLIEAFKRHPNYLEGKFMIAFDMDYDREIDDTASQSFSHWLLGRLQERELGSWTIELPTEIEEQRIREHKVYLPDELFNFIAGLRKYASRTISEETAEKLDRMVPEVHAHTGQKTSRVINKLCTYLGFSKHPDYNKEFAKYADSLSPLKITRHTILSINPIDYLTMSIGNSWSSCHTINRNDGGCYSSGTVSYMLDGSSMVFYTIDASYDGDEYFKERKITRQMFYYGEEKLVQSRLYPQCNDHGATDDYANYRQIVQSIMSLIFDFPNYWTVSKGTSNAGRYIRSEGTHYRDYHHFSNCTLSRIKGSENENNFTVGHDPICIECGDEHSTEDSINCCHGNGYYCECCHDWVDAEDVRWVGDNPYCYDCVSYCEVCGEYYLDGNGCWIESEDRYVCDDCYREYYAVCDHCGGDFDKEDMYWIESEGKYVCGDCFGEHYFTCSHCGEDHHNSEIHTTHYGGIICDDCFETYYFTCEHCGEIYSDTDNVDETNLCPDCYDEKSEAC